MENVINNMRKVLSASWSWQEFNEFISAYSDTHKIKTSWADERIEDEGYYMEWIMNDKQAGSKFQGVSPVKDHRNQSSREKLG